MKTVNSEITNSPRRRSRIFGRASISIAKANEDQNDDEAERAALVAEDKSITTSQFSTPRTVSTARNSSASGISINSPQKEHFQGCLKLYAENKINKDNAWNLQLIDFMSSMLRKHDSRMENLQMASTTLDASTRIYSFRVDAVHYDVLKMAGGLSKAAQGRRGKKPEGEEEENIGEAATDADGNPRKKDKRKKSAKSSISTNVEGQLNAEVEVNECIDPFFAQLAATSGDMTSSNRAFNATLPIDNQSLGLVLRSDVPFLNLEKSDENTFNPDDLPLFQVKRKLFPMVEDNDQLCCQFHGFSITGWDPEDEENKSSTATNKWVENNLNLSQQAMAFDMNADVEPLPHNGFNDYDDGDDILESDEEELGVMQHGIRREKAKSLVHLVDMRPSTQSDGFLEYSYSSTLIGSWAGPCHWKLKNNVNRVSKIAERSNTVTTVIAKKALSRKKKQLDYLGEGMAFSRMCQECPEYSKSAKIMIGLKTLSQSNAWSDKNFKTPIDRGFNLLHFKKFYLPQSIILKSIKEKRNEAEKETIHRLTDINDYDYDNDNDNSYCPNSQPNDDDNGLWIGDEVNGENGGDVHTQNKGFEGNSDMVEPPAKVAKIFIPYAMRSKKVDMKQLKLVTWRMLISEGEAGKENEPNSVEEVYNVKETNFTTLLKKLPLKLSSTMKESLSISLSLLAVLHLANEKGLYLKKNAENTDFTIIGDKQ